MSDTTIFALSLFAFLLAAGGIGTAASIFLPQLFVAPKARTIARDGLQLFAVLAVLTLGTSLVAAHRSFDDAEDHVNTLASEIGTLGHDLSRIGPPAASARAALQNYAEVVTRNVFPGNAGSAPPADSTQKAQAALASALRQLTDAGAAAAHAQAMLYSITETREALAEHAGATASFWQISTFSLWLIALFAGFGVTLRHTLAAAVLHVLGAAAAAGGIFLIAELSNPFHGVITVSDQPLLVVLRALS